VFLFNRIIAVSRCGTSEFIWFSRDIYGVDSETSQYFKTHFPKDPDTNFIYNNFTFRLLHREPKSDIFNYDIHENGNPDTRLRFVFIGVDATCECGAGFSLELVQFCWT